MDRGSALISLCEKVELLAPGSVAGLTICDPAFTRIESAIFPHLPDTFSTAITNVPLEPSNFGSCVQAIARAQAVTCEDIEKDAFFDSQWRKVCLDHGLRAIQSRPIFLNDKPRGTFVLAFPQPRMESEWNASLMIFAADAAGRHLSDHKVVFA